MGGQYIEHIKVIRSKIHQTAMLVFSLTVLLGSTGSLAAGVDIKTLVASDDVSDIKISPTGKYLAVRILRDGKYELRFLDTQSLEFEGGMSFSGSSEVGNFFWANNNRVVAEIQEIVAGESQRRYYGELYASDYNGAKKELIYGYRSGERQTGSHMKKKQANFAWARVVDPLVNDKKHILISSTPMSATRLRKSQVMKLDIYKGIEKRGLKIAAQPFSKFYTDNDGELRLSAGVSVSNNLVAEAQSVSSKSWSALPVAKSVNGFQPITMSKDNKSLIALSDQGDDKTGIYEFSLDDGGQAKIFTHEKVDITEAFATTTDKSVHAARTDDGYPGYLFFGNKEKEAVAFKGLVNTFSGSTVAISSKTTKGHLWVVRISSDINAGSYYLFDIKANSLIKLFAAKGSVSPEALAMVEPVSFESFDGLKVSGYFTPAMGTEKSDKAQPMVVLLNHNLNQRDFWQFDATVQALATNGFSVLQVNYRGSAGYGSKFQAAANQHWGDDVQQDVIAGINWAQKSGKTEAGKVCIMGSEFGAYVALQTATQSPESVACTVVQDGFYDIAQLVTDKTFADQFGAAAYIKKTLGSDAAQWKAFSPTNNIAGLLGPVHIAHQIVSVETVTEKGKSLGNDRLNRNEKITYWKMPAYLDSTEAGTVYNIAQAENLKQVLQSSNKRFEWFTPSKTADRAEYLTAAIGFLKRQIK